jgi:hypothetical protein
MENKLKKIEDFVLEDTVKYFDAQEGKENEKFTFFFVIHQFPISHHYFFLMLVKIQQIISVQVKRDSLKIVLLSVWQLLIAWKN